MKDMSINEFQKAYSERARKNFDLAFCPFGNSMGEDFEITIDCPDCKADKVDSFLSCERKYKEHCEGGKQNG